jgi:hypothetical protein
MKALVRDRWGLSSWPVGIGAIPMAPSHLRQRGRPEAADEHRLKAASVLLRRVVLRPRQVGAEPALEAIGQGNEVANDYLDGVWHMVIYSQHFARENRPTFSICMQTQWPFNVWPEFNEATEH